jgi:hypothetical protein
MPEPPYHIIHVISLHCVVTLLGFCQRYGVHYRLLSTCVGSFTCPGIGAQVQGTTVFSLIRQTLFVLTIYSSFLYVPWPGSNPLTDPISIRIVTSSKVKRVNHSTSRQAMRNWFYVSGPACAPILASQLANIHNGKCIAHWSFKIFKKLNTNFKQCPQIWVIIKIQGVWPWKKSIGLTWTQSRSKGVLREVLLYCIKTVFYPKWRDWDFSDCIDIVRNLLPKEQSTFYFIHFALTIDDNLDW